LFGVSFCWVIEGIGGIGGIEGSRAGFKVGVGVWRSRSRRERIYLDVLMSVVKEF
jgi:hypothetical protein